MSSLRITNTIGFIASIIPLLLHSSDAASESFLIDFHHSNTHNTTHQITVPNNIREIILSLYQYLENNHLFSNLWTDLQQENATTQYQWIVNVIPPILNILTSPTAPPHGLAAEIAVEVLSTYFQSLTNANTVHQSKFSKLQD